jgi:hypothetical protein
LLVVVEVEAWSINMVMVGVQEEEQEVLEKANNVLLLIQHHL